MHNSGLHVATREVWNAEYSFELGALERARHLYLVGMTGTGKSTLISNLVRQDIERGDGVTLLDPHGDLAETIYDVVPSHRIDDVIIVDPTDHAHVVGVNPFYRVPLDDRPRVASNIVSTFKHAWADSWGPRLEYILGNTVRLVLDSPDELRPNFISVARVLVEPGFLDKTLQYCTDRRVESFFRDEFLQWDNRQRREALSPVQNKLGAVLANPFVRNILGQWKPTFSLSEVIAKRRILLVRLPKGALGEEQVSLLGSLIVSGLLHEAMVPKPMAERMPHHLYLDEFQSFATDSFATILSEARKFKLTLTIGHQFTEQLAPTIRAAVFGNVGTMVSFRVGADDATRLAHEYGDVVTSRFRDLKQGQILVKRIGSQGFPVTFFAFTELPKPGVATSRRVINEARQSYTVPRERVEERLSRWLSSLGR